MWIGASALFLLLTVVVGVLLGIERITVDELEVLGNDHVLQFFSLYRVGLTFLVVLPFFLGLATAIVPLQVGASSIAFPRAAAAALWTWIGGAVLLLISYAIDGGPVAAPNLDPEAIALGVLGLGLVVLGLLMASVCVVTTVFALRPVRMSLRQVPPFAWSMVVAGVIWLLSLPVLMAGLVLAYLDLRYGQLLFAQPGELYQRLGLGLRPAAGVRHGHPGPRRRRRDRPGLRRRGPAGPRCALDRHRRLRRLRLRGVGPALLPQRAAHRGRLRRRSPSPSASPS